MQSDALLIRVIRPLLSQFVHRLQRLQAMPTMCRHRRPSCKVYSARFSRMAGASAIFVHRCAVADARSAKTSAFSTSSVPALLTMTHDVAAVVAAAAAAAAAAFAAAAPPPHLAPAPAGLLLPHAPAIAPAAAPPPTPVLASRRRQVGRPSCICMQASRQ